MAFNSYERLVGWRYLLNPVRRPRVLFIGLVVFAIGLSLLGLAALVQSQSGEVSVFGNSAMGAQTLLAVGGVTSAVGGCISVFGALYNYMTVFSAFSTFMITIGVAEVILVLGVMNGFQGDLRSKIIDTQAHVIVEPGAEMENLKAYRALAASIRSLPEVVGATPTLQTEVMLKTAMSMRAISLVGINIETIGETSKLPEQVRQGCLGVLADASARCEPWLLDSARTLQPAAQSLMSNTKEATPPKQPAAEGTINRDPEDEFAFPAPSGKTLDTPAILLGSELYKNVGAWSNEVVNIISPMGDIGPDGPVPRSRPFEVAGQFASGYLQFDTSLAYAGLPSVQRFMGVDDVASSIQVKVSDLEAARRVRDRIKAAHPHLRVTDWNERNHNLFSALKLEKIAMFLVLTINILLAAFSIASTLVMTILERKREIAILMAMGSTHGSITRIFLSQGAFTGVVGSLIGTTIGLSLGLALAKLGLPLNTDVYYIDAIPVDIRVSDVVSIILVAMLVSVVSTIYPARIASGLKPVEGLNAE